MRIFILYSIPKRFVYHPKIIIMKNITKNSMYFKKFSKDFDRFKMTLKTKWYQSYRTFNNANNYQEVFLQHLLAIKQKISSSIIRLCGNLQVLECFKWNEQMFIISFKTILPSFILNNQMQLLNCINQQFSWP